MAWCLVKHRDNFTFTTFKYNKDRYWWFAHANEHTRWEIWIYFAKYSCPSVNITYFLFLSLVLLTILCVTHTTITPHSMLM